MKIALFGASGATGTLLTERCLARGYSVRALLRSPETFAYRDRVEVVRGDATNAQAVDSTVQGADVTLSALGARSLKKEDVLERAVPLIIAAMQRQGKRRLIVLGSSGARDGALRKQNPVEAWLVETLVYKTLLKHAIASQRSQWRDLAGSGLEFTMAMPPRLLNVPGRGTFRVDAEALPRNGLRISREDVADFMMAQVESREWVGKGVYIAW